MKRLSNRRYPLKKCKNSACNMQFEPHDRRQEYCEPQCRINANNDKRFLANNSRFSDEKQMRLNNKILELAWNKLLNLKEKTVPQVNLVWDGFSFQCPAILKKNSETGRNILWYHDYGLELVDASRGIFEIHKKS